MKTFLKLVKLCSIHFRVRFFGVTGPITNFKASDWVFSHSKCLCEFCFRYTKRLSKVYSIVTTCKLWYLFTWTIPLKWLRFISGFKSATFNDLSKIDVTKEIFSLLELTVLFFFIFHWSFRWWRLMAKCKHLIYLRAIWILFVGFTSDNKIF